MEKNHLTELFKTLDEVKHQNGTEYWFARDIAPILGYAGSSGWQNFIKTPINKAKETLKTAGGNVDNHFIDVNRMVEIGSKTQREIDDIKLSRYACYLIAINGDPRKEEIAFAQAYFVVRTREIEVLEKAMLEMERLDARAKLKITEKEFQDMAWSRGVNGSGIQQIRSMGDSALFGGKSTEVMKSKLGITDGKTPLADKLPTVTLKAKDLATAMTNENARQKNLRGKYPILKEHFHNNKNVREALTKTGIYPEKLPPSEDIKQIEARHRQQRKDLERTQRRELDAAKRAKKKAA